MNKNPRFELVVAIALNLVIIDPTLAALAPAQINAIAQQTTVLIAPALTPDLIDELEENRQNPLANQKTNPDGVWNPGSGVIIAKEGKTYYVLTVTHNFKQKHLDENLSYGIRTFDGKVYEVTEVNDGRGCPLQGNPKPEQHLLRFGCYSLNIPKRVDGIDLAIVSFNSETEYPIAALGNSDQVQIGDTVYVSGWPDPEKEKDPTTGKCKGRIAQRTRRLIWGPVINKIAPDRGENGYGIFYLDQTRPGMSGGPVFDSNGLLVGIHGRGSADKGLLLQQYCAIPENKRSPGYESEEIADLIAKSKAETNIKPQSLHNSYSSAQNLQKFTTLLPTFFNIHLSFTQDPKLSIIANPDLAENLNNLGEVGKIDFFARQDVLGTKIAGTLDDSQDQVEDIYDGFQLKNMLRDEPSSGCRFLLLGEPCN